MKFAATPPAPVWPTLKGASVFVRRGARYFWQPLVPFGATATEPADFPTDRLDEDEEENCVEFCQMVFDAAEDRRGQLEQKAQWTFAAIGLITPSLASIFAFVLNDPAFSKAERVVPLLILSLSSVIMLLSYVSAARALWVRGREVLYLEAVIDPLSGAFKAYNAAERARGFLYCASMNTAYNDHVAQFVRGAQMLAALSIILFSAGAVSTAFRSGRGMPASVRIDARPLLPVVEPELARLRDAVGALGARAFAIKAELRMARESAAIGELASRINNLEAARAAPTPPQQEVVPVPRGSVRGQQLRPTNRGRAPARPPRKVLSPGSP